MCCSPMNITELSESVLVEDIAFFGLKLQKVFFLVKIIKEREWRSGLQ